MMQFFLKRGQQVQGPFSRDQIVAFVNAKQIGGADQIAQSSEGPFQQLSQVWATISNPQAAVQAMPSAVACTACGSSIPADSEQCPLCNTPQANATMLPQSQTQIPGMAALPQQTPASQDYYTKQLAAANATDPQQTKSSRKKKKTTKKKKSGDSERKKLILFGGVAVGLLVILVVGIFLSYALAGPPPEYNAADVEETAEWIKAMDEMKDLAASFKLDTNKGGIVGSNEEQKELVAAISEKLKPYLDTKVNWKVFLWADSRKPKLGGRKYLEFGNAYNVGSKGVNTAILFRVRAEVLDSKDAHDQSPKHSLKRDLYSFARMQNSSPDYIQHGETFDISATIAEIRVYANAYDFGKVDSAFKTSEHQKLAAEAHMATTLLAKTVDTDWAKLSEKRSKLGNVLTSQGHFGAFVDIILKIDDDWSPEESMIRSEAKDRTFLDGGQSSRKKELEAFAQPLEARPKIKKDRPNRKK